MQIKISNFFLFSSSFLIGFLILCIGFSVLTAILLSFNYFPLLGLNDVSLDAWIYLLNYPNIWKSIANAIIISIISTTLSLLFSFYIILFFIHKNYFKPVSSYVFLVGAFPQVAFIAGFITIFGSTGFFVNAGLVGDFFVRDSFGAGIIFALVLKETPFLVALFLFALQQISWQKWQQVSASLGHHSVSGYFRVLFPVLYKQSKYGIYIILAFSLTNVEYYYLLLSNVPLPISVQILYWFNLAEYSWAMAGALSQLFMILFIVFIWSVGEKIIHFIWKKNLFYGIRNHILIYTHLFSGKAIFATFVFLTISITFGLVILAFTEMIIFGSFIPETIGFANWNKIHMTLVDSISSTIFLGASVSVISVIITIIILESISLEQGIYLGKNSFWKRAFNTIYLNKIPFIRNLNKRKEDKLILYFRKFTPLNLFIILTLPQLLIFPGLNSCAIILSSLLDIEINTTTILIIGHLLIAVPYVFLTLHRIYLSVPKRWQHVTQSLGHSYSSYLFRVKLPLLKKNIFIALFIGFIISVAQYTSTVILGQGNWNTLAIETTIASTGLDKRIMAIFGLSQILVILAYALLLISIYYISLIRSKCVYK